MRFMMLMIPKGYETAAPGTGPSAETVSAMMGYNRRLEAAGVPIELNGLQPPSAGARVSFPGGKPRVAHGPFAEANGVVGGYWIIRAESLDAAIEWARGCPASEKETIEIRPIHEMEDFPAEVRRAAEGSTEMQRREAKP